MVVGNVGLPVLMIGLCLKHMLRWLFVLVARFQNLGKFNMALSGGYYQELWVPILSLPFTSCVSLSELCNFSVLQFFSSEVWVG